VWVRLPVDLSAGAGTFSFPDNTLILKLPDPQDPANIITHIISSYITLLPLTSHDISANVSHYRSATIG
jgi:hypothetical protein